VNIRSQKIGVYSGYIFMVMLLIGFAWVAGFFPPPSPNSSAQDIQNLVQHHTLRIRFGMLISLLSSAFLLPWGATVATQVRRIEGTRHTPITYLQLIGFGTYVILFVYPEMMWATVAYRPDDPADLVRKFNDMAWMGFVSIVSTGMMQMLGLGYVILHDQRAVPIFPRWFGYFNVWIAFMFIPADIIFFFKTGPFAWNGLFGFGLSFAAFFLWTALVTLMMGRAVKAQEAAGEDSDPELAALTARIDELCSELHRATSVMPAPSAVAHPPRGSDATYTEPTTAASSPPPAHSR
jgi:hypothetical protein